MAGMGAHHHGLPDGRGIHARFRRQTKLGNLSDESIRAMLYGHKAKRRDTSAERHEEADPSAAVTAIIPTIPPTKEGRHAR